MSFAYFIGSVCALLKHAATGPVSFRDIIKGIFMHWRRKIFSQRGPSGELSTGRGRWGTVDTLMHSYTAALFQVQTGSKSATQ